MDRNRILELQRPAHLHVTGRSVIIDRELFVGLLNLLAGLIQDKPPDLEDALPQLTLLRLSLCLCELLEQRGSEEESRELGGEGIKKFCATS